MNRNSVFQNILPDHFIEQLRELSLEHSRQCWKMGHLARIAIKKLGETKTDIVTGRHHLPESMADYILAFTDTDMLICMADELGISFDTLRDYWYVVQFFDNDTVLRYGEFLPFSYFRFAKSCGEDQAVRVLELAAAEKERRGNRNPGLTWLRMQFVNAAGDPGVVDGMGAVDEFDNAAAQYYGADDFETTQTEQNQAIPAPVFYLITAARKFLVALEKNIGQVSLSKERREKILMLIEGLQELSEELRQEYE